MVRLLSIQKFKNLALPHKVVDVDNIYIMHLWFIQGVGCLIEFQDCLLQLE
jgi:hypothetical protein